MVVSPTLLAELDRVLRYPRIAERILLLEEAAWFVGWIERPRRSSRTSP